MRGSVSRAARRQRATAVRLVIEHQALPYRWPAPPQPALAREQQRWTCASKHEALATALEARLGLRCTFVLALGRLIPASLQDQPRFRGLAEIVEVHEYLAVDLPWVGTVALDVTWDPPLIDAGVAATRDWDGTSDMTIAVQPIRCAWPAPRSLDERRSAKEQIRRRVHGPGGRTRRERGLAALSAQFEMWREAAQP